MSTGFTKKQVAAMRERDDNQCAWTGVESDRLIPQHRKNRGAGGSKLANHLSNGVLLDSLLNGLIESDAGLQAQASLRGIKVSQYEDPATIPVLYPDGVWYLLSDDGLKTPYAGDWEG